MAKKRLLADNYLSNLMATMAPAPAIPSPVINDALMRQLLKEEKKEVAIANINITQIKEEIGNVAVKYMGKKGRLVQEKIGSTNTLREITASLKDIEKFASLFLKSKIADQMLEEMNWTINQSTQF